MPTCSLFSSSDPPPQTDALTPLHPPGPMSRLSRLLTYLLYEHVLPILEVLVNVELVLGKHVVVHHNLAVWHITTLGYLVLAKCID